MDDFPLIKKLQHPEEITTSPLPQGRKYVEIDVMVEGQAHKILVPQREYDNIITENLNDLSQHDFRMLLRKYRGVRG